LPEARGAATWYARAVAIEPTGAKLDVPSNSSALSRHTSVGPGAQYEPPAIRTFPEGSSVAVCSARAADIEPVAVKVPMPSKSSALERV